MSVVNDNGVSIDIIELEVPVINVEVVEIRGFQGDKGEKGDPLTFDDLTPEQKESLRGPQGLPGRDGKDGLDGSDGATFKPTVNANGDLSWENDKGLANPEAVNIKGPKGDSGVDGATFKPFVNSEGDVSWTNDQGLQNPPTVNIKGPQGKQGEQGKAFTFDDFTPEQIDSLKIKGDKGEKGDPGNALEYLGSYETFDDLKNAKPVGEKGDIYFIHSTDETYFWSVEQQEWVSIGVIKGESANEILMTPDPEKYFLEIYGQSTGDIIGSLVVNQSPIFPDPSDTFASVLDM